MIKYLILVVSFGADKFNYAGKHACGNNKFCCAWIILNTSQECQNATNLIFRKKGRSKREKIVEIVIKTNLGLCRL